MASKVIELFIKKALFKKGGAMASNKSVKFSADALEKRIKNFGFDPDTINSEAQLNQILAYLKQAEDQAFNQLYGNVLSGDDAANFLKKAFKLDKDNVFDMTGKKIDTSEGIMGGKSVKELMESGEITKGTVTKKSDKVKEREMFKEANEKFNKTDIIADTVAKITSMEPVAALKEANKVIRREGIYKNLDATQSKKILTDSEDWIFQRDPNDLYDYNKNRPFRDDPDFDPDDPDYQDYVKNRDRDDYYTGGMVDVEPSLSDIGHGSDALMARTRLISPGAQGTTSTGLNYLLAEDNDNIRIPFSKGNGVADEDAEKAALGKRVRELMDDGYDFGEAVKQAMSEGYAEGGRIGFSNGLMVDPIALEDQAFKAAMNAFKYYVQTGGKKNFRDYMRMQSQVGKAGGGIENFRAEGGRIGFKTGTDQSKRAFLKLLAALGGGIATLKSGLLSFGGKGATKKLLSPIQTDNVAGKPEWFDALVTKIIKEGDDVTKNFKTKEREIIHKKKLNEDETAIVTQDLDEGSITVELDSPNNMYGDKVQLRYKKPNPDEGDPNPSAEFDVAESGPVGRAYGPDDYEIEIDELGGTSIKDLSSDVSILKEYATGKKPTIKEMVQNMKRKDKAKRISEGGENEMDEVIKRQGEFIENDLVDLDPPEFAAGGRIGFSSGKLAITGSSRRFLEKVFGKEGFENIIRTDPDMYKGMLEVVEMFRNRNKEGLKMYLQKYLPHMDDEMIEDFIVGSGGSEGIQGQLIRLGSGRDYAQKLEMMKKADQMKKLSDLEVTDEMVRKPNASGGIAKLLGE